MAAFARARGAASDEDARDATQEFFLWMLESGFLDRADPERGCFRGFIKKSLSNFLHDRGRAERTVKRGGSHGFLSLGEVGESLLELEDPDGSEPGEVLDAVWRRELLLRASTALERELEAKGKSRTFAVFRDFFLADEPADYAALAERYEIKESDVSNALAYAKNRYRSHLRAAVLETVGSDEDLRAELGWLFADRGVTK